jgi:drug/metabolite transporter (DMT)-like permease
METPNAKATPTPELSSYKIGVAFLILSAITFSTAGIFTKAVSADAWSIIFWRGLSGTIFAVIFLLFRSKLKDELKRFGFSAWLVAILGASGTAAFIPAFKLTSVAHVSLIWAIAPFIAALMAWVTIREHPTRWVLICSAIALIGVGITVSHSVGSNGMLGDMLALWMTLMMAATMVVYRIWPDTPTVLPAALSSVILLTPAVILTDPIDASQFEISILIIFGLVFSIASVTLAEGARRVPAARAALISALETPLAPIWALILLAEVPTQQTMLGGTIIMIAILLSQRK